MSVMTDVENVTDVFVSGTVVESLRYAESLNVDETVMIGNANPGKAVIKRFVEDSGDGYVTLFLAVEGIHNIVNVSIPADSIVIVVSA